jgi:hypothetical protein
MDESHDYGTLRELAGLDRRRRELVTLQTRLPAEVEKRRAALEARREEAARVAAGVDAAHKERRQLEALIADRNDRLAKYRSQLDAVKTNREYQSLQHEIAATKQEIAGAEDRVLELMERGERVQKDLGARKEALAAFEAEVAAADERDRAQLADVEIQLIEVEEKRKRFVPALAPALRGEYLRVYEHYRGDAFATAKEGYCEGCYVNIPAKVLSELRGGARVYRCESCGRLIIFIEEEWKP